MSFLLPCPNCGKRSVYEFQFGGEVLARPPVDASREAWTSYVYWRDNSPAVQKEWWFHRLGCKLWFIAERNTTSNQVLASYFAEQAPPGENR
ncbi:MAG TPA: sarcosine oxidase subunit delta [Bryobacterales bacterium]|nr:sarcosine oxidase subunit delta [Bryobacterales bacterium]